MTSAARMFTAAVKAEVRGRGVAYRKRWDGAVWWLGYGLLAEDAHFPVPHAWN
jgi:hypothetical protein